MDVVQRIDNPGPRDVHELTEDLWYKKIFPNKSKDQVKSEIQKLYQDIMSKESPKRSESLDEAKRHYIEVWESQRDLPEELQDPILYSKDDLGDLNPYGLNTDKLKSIIPNAKDPESVAKKVLFKKYTPDPKYLTRYYQKASDILEKDDEFRKELHKLMPVPEVYTRVRRQGNFSDPNHPGDDYYSSDSDDLYYYDAIIDQAKRYGYRFPKDYRPRNSSICIWNRDKYDYAPSELTIRGSLAANGERSDHLDPKKWYKVTDDEGVPHVVVSGSGYTGPSKIYNNKEELEKDVNLGIEARKYIDDKKNLINSIRSDISSGDTSYKDWEKILNDR